jgi:Ca2+-binding EF-hand superfamily protein
VDTDKNGKLDFNEFVQMSKNGILKADSIEENAKQLFKLFDENYDGFITLSEFNRVTSVLDFDEIDGKFWNEILSAKPDKRITLNGNSFMIHIEIN